MPDPRRTASVPARTRSGCRRSPSSRASRPTRAAFIFLATARATSTPTILVGGRPRNSRRSSTSARTTPWSRRRTPGERTTSRFATRRRPRTSRTTSSAPSSNRSSRRPSTPRGSSARPSTASRTCPAGYSPSSTRPPRRRPILKSTASPTPRTRSTSGSIPTRRNWAAGSSSSAATRRCPFSPSRRA